MGKKVLVIEIDRGVVKMIQATLEEEGYEVITSADPSNGLELSRREQPTLVIVAFKLPKMRGSTVARRIRKDPATDHQAVMMIVEESELENLVIGPASGVDDFLIKPFDAAELVTKIKPLIASRDAEQGTSISTGNGELDNKMGGGIPLGSLTLIEGDSGAGKSVLSQQMMRGSLDDGYSMSLFTSENSVKSLVKQMRSLSLDIIDYLLLQQMRIYPIEVARLGEKAPSTLLEAMKKDADRDMLFVDSLTSAIPDSSPQEVMGFFEECKRLCSSGVTIIVVVHSHGLNRELLIRIRSLCDAHIQLRTEELGNKLVKTLEATKVRGADKRTGNIISFEVEPGWGMRVIPITKIGG
ncbi:MAG: response regulator [Anaerolineales bacterium]|nr:response regulator [Anaerolineales bacterium]